MSSPTAEEPNAAEIQASNSTSNAAEIQANVNAAEIQATPRNTMRQQDLSPDDDLKPRPRRVFYEDEHYFSPYKPPKPAIKPIMGGVTDDNVPWTGGAPNYEWTGLQNPNAIPEIQMYRSKSVKSESSRIKRIAGLYDFTISTYPGLKLVQF